MVLSFCVAVLLLMGSLTTAIQKNEGNNSPSVSIPLPTFTWKDTRTINLMFPDGQTDLIHLRPADQVGHLNVPCLFEGSLEGERSSHVAVSGCWADDVVDLVIYTTRLQGQHMFRIRNATTEKVGKISKGGIMKGQRRIGKRVKRGIFLGDDDYDEIEFDAGQVVPDPLPFYVFDVRLGFEENFQKKAGTEEKAREMVARIFTLGKLHFRHAASLGTSIRLRPQGEIRKINGKFWKPGGLKAKDLKDSMNYKLDDQMPTTFFCGSNDEGNNKVRGSSYVRRGCHIKKGVALVAFDEDIQQAAQTYGHESGHWLGFSHDLDVDRRDGSRCEGTGLMSNASRPGGRPSRWSVCSKERLKFWLNRPENNCLKKDKELYHLDSAFDCQTWKSDSSLLKSGCSRPVDLKQGQWICTDEGAICSPVCHLGYKLAHPSGLSAARCFNNTWIDNLQDFSCVCNTEFQPPHGSLSCSGNQCSLICQPGYYSSKMSAQTKKLDVSCVNHVWNKDLSGIACDFKCHSPDYMPSMGSWKFETNGCGIHLSCPTSSGLIPSDTRITIFMENEEKWSIELDTFSCIKVPSLLIKSSGLASEHNGGHFGYFDEISSKQNQRPTYKQRGGNALLYHSNAGTWFIGDTLGKNTGWLSVKSNSMLPPSSGWVFWDGKNDITDENMKLTFDPPIANVDCNNILVASSGDAGIYQSSTMGLYQWKKGLFHNGVKIYTNGRYYLQVPTGQSTWMIMSSIDAATVRISSGRSTMCPCDDKAGPSKKNGWDWWVYARGGNLMVDKTISITCL